jgi:hypothetical protein
MKLHKQTRLKAVLIAAVAALMAAFFGIVKAEPEIETEPVAPPSLNYDGFFAPNRSTTPGPTPVDRPPPHTRSRAS